MFPTLLQIGDFRLATYGVLVALGYLAGILWLTSQREKMGLDESRFWGLIYALFAGAILGGKLLYWAVEWRDVVAGTLRPIRDFRYGFVFFGGFLGSVFAGWLYRRRRPFDYMAVADHFVVALPVGHAIGRIGCMMAGCCAGKPTDLPWGVSFTHPQCLVDPAFLGTPLHPVQLYEAGANALIAVLLFVLIRRVWKGGSPPGTVFLAYFGLYSASRFVVEFFRGDYRGGFLLGLSVSQWIAVACVVAAAAAARKLFRGGKRAAQG